MQVKVFVSAKPGVAIVTDRIKTVRYPIHHDEKMMNKMNRKDRAYFEARLIEVDGSKQYQLGKRLPNQGW